MAHFAELDKDNVVLRVLVISDEHEQDGEQWCKATFGGVAWKQTSYNARIRKNYATVGGTYDPQRDAFIPVKVFPSWVLDEQTCNWVAPVPQPTEPGRWMWDEETQSWVNREAE